MFETTTTPSEFVDFESANLGPFEFPQGLTFTVGAGYTVITPNIRLELGSGHFGTVFFGTGDTGPVAIKALERRSGALDGQIANEIRILKTLGKHSNIVEYHGEYTFSSEYIFLVTQYGGTSLAQLRQGRFGQPGWKMLVKKYTRDVVQGLYHLHEHCFVTHRDVKPHNIVIIDGTAKLTDFGISHRIDHRGIPDFNGTVAYMAPEVLSGELRWLNNPAWDVWSLGMTVLDLLYGEHPNESLKNVSENPDHWRFFLVGLYKSRADFFQQFAVDFSTKFPTQKKGDYADCLQSFLRQCLVEPKARSRSGQLLSHPFLLLTENGDYAFQNAGTTQPPIVFPAGCRTDSIPPGNVLLRFSTMLEAEAFYSINYGDYQRYSGEAVELRGPGDYTVRAYAQHRGIRSRVDVHTYHLSAPHPEEQTIDRSVSLRILCALNT